MSMFQIPQFIDQKPKIVGSLNLLQFGYIGGAGLLIFGLYYVFTFFVWILISLPIAGLAVILSFVKINGQESHKILASFLKYFFGSKIYIWKQAPQEEVVRLREKSVIEKRQSMGLQEKIKSIATMVTTGKKAADEPQKNKEEAQKKEEFVTFGTGEKRLVNRIDY